MLLRPQQITWPCSSWGASVCTPRPPWGSPCEVTWQRVWLLRAREGRVRVSSPSYTQIPGTPRHPQSHECRDPRGAGPQQGQVDQGHCLRPELPTPQSVSQRRDLELWGSEYYLRSQGNLPPLPTPTAIILNPDGEGARGRGTCLPGDDEPLSPTPMLKHIPTSPKTAGHRAWDSSIPAALHGELSVLVDFWWPLSWPGDILFALISILFL